MARTEEAGRGEETQKRTLFVSPTVRDPLPPFELPPSHTSLQISLYFGIHGEKSKFVCLLIFFGDRERSQVPPSGQSWGGGPHLRLFVHLMTLPPRPP